MAGSTRRSLVLGATAVVLLALAAYLYFSRADAGSAALPDEYTVHAVCLACRQEARISAPIRQSPPLVCPHCGERAAYSWFYCERCRKRVIPNLQPAPDGGPPKIPMIATCRLCGSPVGTYIPESPEHQPIGDAPLPEWPPK